MTLRRGTYNACQNLCLDEGSAPGATAIRRLLNIYIFIQGSTYRGTPLQEASSWFTRLMATGQGEPIAHPMADVKRSPINYNETIQSLHEELRTKVMTVGV